jgi:vacuolar-type H+-ATPase subunit E/Vma4
MSDPTPPAATPALIAGIAEDAQLQADKLIREAREAVKSRLAAAEQQAAGILREARDRVDQQIENIRKNTDSAIAVETRRQVLRSRDQVVRHILDTVRAEIRTLITTPEYPDVLSGWIVEAILGLDAVDLRVNASKDELPLLDSALLRKVQQEVQTLTGRKVHLERSTDPPLLAQGIVVTEHEGRTAFNNQIQTRLLRYQSEIIRLIHEALFQEDQR